MAKNKTQHKQSMTEINIKWRQSKTGRLALYYFHFNFCREIVPPDITTQREEVKRGERGGEERGERR